MIIGFSIRKNAENVGVCVKTSFYMRHKVLDCIRAFMGVGDVDGIVEMDETFVAESFKGNHKKSGFKMPRPARKRGKQIYCCPIKSIEYKRISLGHCIFNGRVLFCYSKPFQKIDS